MPNQNNLPLYFEELKIKEDSMLTLSDLLTQFKQQIPVNFVYLEIKERNYQCSTTGWKEPVCERYGFEYQGQWKQIDIPHPLMDKLELKKGEDLPSAFYLAPHLLKKDQATTQGGITLQEGEIILINPRKLVMKDQAIQTDLNSAKIKELEETIAKQSKQLKAKDTEIAGLKSEKQTLENTEKQVFDILEKFSNKSSLLEKADHIVKGLEIMNDKLSSFDTVSENELNERTYEINVFASSSLSSSVGVLAQKVFTLVYEYKREKFWWDKWINCNSLFITNNSSNPETDKVLFFYVDPSNPNAGNVSQTFFISIYRDYTLESNKKMKLLIKDKIHQYYRIT